MKKILITGGAGFIGSNLIKRLLHSTDLEIFCLDNFDPFYSVDLKRQNLSDVMAKSNFHLIVDDILNESTLYQFKNIDVIIHLAAKPGVRNSIHQAKIYQEVNVIGTTCILEYAKITGIKKVILASSSSIYGNNKNTPWKESENPNPANPYAVSKVAAEMLGRVYSRLHDIQVIALRFFTAYGPSQRPDLAISTFFDCIYQNKSVKVFGDGSALRDFTFIDDIVAGIISAIDVKIDGFEEFNIGTEKNVSINELLELIQKVCQLAANIEYAPAQKGEVPITCADISKAKQWLNYEPQINLLEGLIRYNEWYKTKYK